MRGIVTTVLDLAGALLIVAAIAVAAARVDPALGLLAAGLGLLLVSWAGDKAAARAAARQGRAGREARRRR